MTRPAIKTLVGDATLLREIAHAVAAEGGPLTASVLRKIAGDIDRVIAELKEGIDGERQD